MAITVQPCSKAYPMKKCCMKNSKAVIQLLLNCDLYMERVIFVLAVSEVLQLIQNSTVAVGLSGLYASGIALKDMVRVVTNAH